VVIYAFFELLHQSPQEGLRLLAGWGPRFLLWVLLMLLVYDLLKGALHWLGRGVVALEGTSSAIKALAGKDDVQRREDQLLLDHLNNQVDRIRENQQHLEERVIERVGRIDDRIAEEFRTMRKLQEE
jgi:hypothetical protein